MVQHKQQGLREARKNMLTLAIAGGVAFWAANFVTSLTPLAAEYRAALSISYLPMILVESVLGGMIVAFLVSYSLLRFFEKIPTKNPIVKSVILSLVALVTFEAISILANPNNLSTYLLIGTILNMPRFLALGMAVGHLYGRIDSGTSIRR